MTPLYADIGMRQPKESGGSCQMTIVTFTSGCGNAYPGGGTRDGAGREGDG
jgi:hypothetical protein